MRIITYILIGSILSTFFIGCEESSISTQKLTEWSESDISVIDDVYLFPEELTEWVNDNSNGLKIEKEIDEYRFSTFYKPLDYIVATDLNKKEITKDELIAKKGEIEDLQYFTFRIGLKTNEGDLLKHNLREANEYYARVEHFSFAMQNDIVLFEGQDTLKCVLYHFERTYGTAPFLNFNLAFEKTQNKEDKTLIINDQVLGIGRVKLTIPKENILRIPKLKTS